MENFFFFVCVCYEAETYIYQTLQTPKDLSAMSARHKQKRNKRVRVERAGGGGVKLCSGKHTHNLFFRPRGLLETHRRCHVVEIKLT